MRIDARIPVRIVSLSASGSVFGSSREPASEAAAGGWPPGLPEADPEAALLIVAPLSARAHLVAADWLVIRHVEAGQVATATDQHPPGCMCCVVRSPLAVIFSTLFEQRARGTLGLFRRVWLLAPPEIAQEARAMLGSDPLVSGRYRTGEI
jgi:hypothetical protein